MSEKRILIKEFTKSPCTGCSGAGENDCDNCYDWDTWNSCLTRDQAIEKISSFFCVWTGICIRLGQATANAMLKKPHPWEEQ